MLWRNIDYFLQKRKYEKLAFSEMNSLKIFLFPWVFIFDFFKNMNPRLCILFLADKSVT